MEKPDKTLVREVLAGDAQAFRGLVERYQDRLFDLAFRMTRSRQEAEDLVQTAFVRMFKNLGRFDPRYSFSNWAYTITLNLARNHLRRKAVIRFLSLDFGSEERGETDMAEPASPGMDEKLLRKDFSSDLAAMIQELPRPLKECLILHYIHEKSVSDIAGMLGLTTNAVKLRLFRARNALREQISRRHPEYLKPQE